MLPSSHCTRKDQSRSPATSSNTATTRWSHGRPRGEPCGSTEPASDVDSHGRRVLVPLRAGPGRWPLASSFRDRECTLLLESRTAVTAFLNRDFSFFESINWRGGDCVQGRHPTAAMSRSNVVLTTIVVCLVTGAVSQQPQISVVNGNKVRQVPRETSGAPHLRCPLLKYSRMHTCSPVSLHLCVASPHSHNWFPHTTDLGHMWTGVTCLSKIFNSSSHDEMRYDSAHYDHCFYRDQTYSQQPQIRCFVD